MGASHSVKKFGVTSNSKFFLVAIRWANEIHIYGHVTEDEATQDFHNGWGSVARIVMNRKGQVKESAWGNGDTQGLLNKAKEEIVAQIKNGKSFSKGSSSSDSSGKKKSKKKKAKSSKKRKRDSSSDSSDSSDQKKPKKTKKAKSSKRDSSSDSSDSSDKKKSKKKKKAKSSEKENKKQQ